MSRTQCRGQNRGRYRKQHRLAALPPTESTCRVLGGTWHSHHSERLAERVSKRHAKRNAHRGARLDGAAEIKRQLEDCHD